MERCLLYKSKGLVLNGIHSLTVLADLQQQIIKNDGNSISKLRRNQVARIHLR